jgi:hypothetical protein
MLYTTLPKRFTPRPGLAHPHVTAITSTRHTSPPFGLAHSATPDSDGQDHRPVPTPRTAPRHGARPARPNCHHGALLRRVCHSHGICGLASTATSRCRSVRPVGPFEQGPRIGPEEGAPTSGTASPSPTTAHRQHPRQVANHASRGRPNGTSQRRWGGSTPTTPLLSVRGCKWGSTPLSSISCQTWSEHVERVQVTACTAVPCSRYIELIQIVLFRPFPCIVVKFEVGGRRLPKTRHL